MHQFQAEERVEGGVKTVGLFFEAKTIEKYSLDKDYKALRLSDTFNYVKEGNEIIVNGAFRQTVGDNYPTSGDGIHYRSEKSRDPFPQR